MGTYTYSNTLLFFKEEKVLLVFNPLTRRNGRLLSLARIYLFDSNVKKVWTQQMTTVTVVCVRVLQGNPHSSLLLCLRRGSRTQIPGPP